METKLCPKCEEVKPVAEWYRRKGTKDGLQTQCKACASLAYRDWEARNPEKVKERNVAARVRTKEWYAASAENRARQKAQSARWRKLNPERHAASNRKSKLKVAYGITQEDVQGMAAAQDHRCAICLRKRKLVVDHCHQTGRVRGLLCDGCNWAIGVLGDKNGALQRAADYVAGPVAPEPFTFVG